ncbi:hypothetical protein [Desulfosporosinus meridiei]|uniref:Uncharacterized protein n=1 Tax=Desulfosporosinus meridiei (strain ATCC BAA-275 / DSM 13257 / KCTC 12902 / NCIMB 13706 / S10) TaxID=768704 RepID=J7IXZ3_DESMD|nr:hypothetical protein [Desulfosporosinus meridiei]AFQ43973.1 hypothetical protein Desmer_2028 [Desulfosporosinus meridiei DSM 13257]
MDVLSGLGIILLGLIAWIFPIVNLARRKKSENKSWVAFSLTSVSACAITLFIQIVSLNHLVDIEDWSAIMDTTNALVLVSSVYLFITLALNLIAFLVYSIIQKK